MDSIIIYPKDKKQKTLLGSLLKEMNVRFEIEDTDETLMTKEEFYARIEEARQEAREGKVITVKKEDLKSFLGL